MWTVAQSGVMGELASSVQYVISGRKWPRKMYLVHCSLSIPFLMVCVECHVISAPFFLLFPVVVNVLFDIWECHSLRFWHLWFSSDITEACKEAKLYLNMFFEIFCSIRKYWGRWNVQHYCYWDGDPKIEIVKGELQHFIESTCAMPGC